MLNFENFKDIYGLSKDISHVELSSFFNEFESKQYKKNDILLHSGTERTFVFLVIKGLIGKFKLAENGEKKLFEIYPEENAVLNLDMIISGTPSEFSFEALEESTVLIGDLEQIQYLLRSIYPNLNSNLYHFYRKLLINAQKKIELFVYWSPKERFKIFLKEYPNLINRIADKYIASFLGIHPVTFSRLKKQVLMEK